MLLTTQTNTALQAGVCGDICGRTTCFLDRRSKNRLKLEAEQSGADIFSLMTGAEQART